MLILGSRGGRWAQAGPLPGTLCLGTSSEKAKKRWRLKCDFREASQDHLRSSGTEFSASVPLMSHLSPLKSPVWAQAPPPTSVC